MRSSTDWKRCGCGNIIGLRESCARCADAARARLHAEGVAAVEVWWLDSSPKPYQQDALRCVEQAKHEQPPVGAEVAWDVAKADMQARSEARYKISSDLGVEYSYAARGALSCRNDELEAWRTSVMHEDACSKRRWVRLA